MKRKAILEDLLFEQQLRNRQNIFWKTKDGKEIPITEMSDSHLDNAINLLIRNENFECDDCNEIN